MAPGSGSSSAERRTSAVDTLTSLLHSLQAEESLEHPLSSAELESSNVDEKSLNTAADEYFLDALEHLDFPLESAAGVVEALADLHEVFHDVPEQIVEDAQEIFHDRREEQRQQFPSPSVSTGAAPLPPVPRTPRVRRLGRRLVRKAWGPGSLLLRDKVSFLLGSTMLWGCAYWLGASPSTFHRLYTVLGLGLMALRYISYKSKNWHYYLFDFCYYANLLLVMHLWLVPKSRVLHMVTFAYNAGPLTVSILTFRNSLVFHDMEKVTSLFLHIVPACVSWTLRWHPPHGIYGPYAMTKKWGMYPGFVNIVLIPGLAYLIWAVAYYLLIFVISAAKIQRRGYQTLFVYVTSQTKGTFYEIARRVPRSMQPVVYLALHYCFCLTTFYMAWASWNSKWLHTSVLVTMASFSIWHGANYYFEVFARKYHARLTDAMQQIAADATGGDQFPVASTLPKKTH